MKDILVQADGGECNVRRIKAAVNVAERLGAARLTGLFAQSDYQGPAVVARRPSDQLRQAAVQARDDFERATKGTTIATRWLELAHGEPSYVVFESVFCSRYADLIILGQQHPERVPVPEDLAEQVILNSGRPALVLPHSGDFPEVGRRIAVAWNGSREATRALHDSLPFLLKAAEVHILTVHASGTGAADARRDAPMVGIADHLATVGVKAKIERLSGEDIGVMDLLLSRAFDLGCDMMVMGGHSGLALGIFRGAGTRFMLRHMTLPVLMGN